MNAIQQDSSSDALPSENLTPSPRPVRLTPVIRVWEGDFELVDVVSADDTKITRNSEKQSAPDKSYIAWQQESPQQEGDFTDSTTNTNNNTNPSVLEKATSMAHEMVHLMSPGASSEGLNQDGDDNSSDEIEMDGVFEFDSKSAKTKKKQQQRNDQEKLLAAKRRDRDADGDSLSSLEDNDRPSFESTHLVFDASVATSTTTIENKYMRENSEPVIIEAGDDKHGIRNSSFSEDFHTGSEGSLQQQRGPKNATDGIGNRKHSNRKHSKVSRTSSAGSRSGDSSNNMEEDIELNELSGTATDVAHIRHFSSSSGEHSHERTGLLESTTMARQPEEIGKFSLCFPE